jgi:hypothetical protein
MGGLSTENLGELHMAIVALLLKPTDISLRVFSLVELYTAIYLRRDLFDTGAGGDARLGVSPKVFEATVQQWFQRPSTRLSGDCVTVHYDVPITLAIAAQSAKSPPAIGQWVLDAVRNGTSGSLPPSPDAGAVCLQVELRITDQGWLRWGWGPAAIVVWLDQAARSILQWPLPRLALPRTATPDRWPALHAYARCRVWVESGLSPDPQDVGDRFDPLDQAVLLKLMDVIDKLADLTVPPPIDLYIQVEQTAVQAFESFDRRRVGQAANIFSPIQLGLVMLIKNLLYQVLHQGFGLKVAEKI